MKDYDVTITETLEMTVTVNAASRMEAEQLVNERWKKGDYIRVQAASPGLPMAAPLLVGKERTQRFYDLEIEDFNE